MNFARKRRDRGSRKRTRRCHTESTYQRLEARQLLASVGWDGPGQGGAELTYFIGKAPAGISQTQFESTIENALKVWSDVIDVKFTRTQQAGLDDSLDFTSRPIDGQGGVLARAYFPDDVNRNRIAGDVEFDVHDKWEVGNAQGSRAFDLMYVAVHEIGHALGIEHINSHSAVLAPSVNGNQTFLGLSQHDIDAAMELYAPTKSTPPTTPPTNKPPTSESPDTPPAEKPDEPSQPPTVPGDSPDPDQEFPTGENPDDDSTLQPDVEQPDAQPDPSNDQPAGDEADKPTDPDDDDGGDQIDPDNDINRIRFERFLNYLLQRFRFAFWSPFQFFIRW